MTERPVFILRLQPIPGADPVRALRWVLKVLLRRCGLRCVSVTQEAPYDAAADFEGSINDCYRAIRERVAAGGPTWTPKD